MVTGFPGARMERVSGGHAAVALLVLTLAGLAPRCAALLEPADAALRCSQRDFCQYVGGSAKEHEYKVEDKNIVIDHLTGSYINVECNGHNVLESSALPSAVPELRVTQVTLSNCPLPANSSLADTLAALNVTLVCSPPGVVDKVFGSLKLERLTREPPLTQQHFRGLEDLRELRLAASSDEHVRPESGFLKPLKNLVELNVQEVALPANELDDPPHALRTLRLRHAGVERLSEALLSSVSLRQLTVTSNSALDAVAVPRGLLELDLQSPATKLQLDVAPELRLVTLTNWVETEPGPLTNCSKLTLLRLISPAVRKLPAHWLANCSVLETLELQYATNLTSLPQDLLTNVSALTSLSFKTCDLETLPARLLDNVPKLRQFYLTENRNLRTLSSGTFTIAREVRVLNLSSNNLDTAALAALAPLEQLTSLDLTNNPNIRDLCETTGKSPMSESTQLTKLILRRTNVNQICSDWLHEMPFLKMLDLSFTNVSELWFKDLQFERSIDNAAVILTGAPLTVVGMTGDNFNLAMRQSRNDALVQIDKNSKLKCDCRMYWTWRSLKEHYNPLKHVFGMRCNGMYPLENMQPDDLLCDDNDTYRECQAASIPANCSCGWRPHEDSSSGRKVVRVDCRSRQLSHFPLLQTAPDASNRVYELLLQYNNITELRADMLRPDITRLDLRNNSLTTVNWESVGSPLRNFRGMLQVAGNPLDCTCSAAPLLRALNSRANLTDVTDATCATGGTLDAVSHADCPALVIWLTSAAALLLAFAVVVVVFLSSRERRYFLKAVLHRWGCLWYPADAEENDGRSYDAFVTFSHKDEPTVLELVSRLEPPYRLCVHYRDWIPGRYITEQIEESVQDSRRTIALVSRHFLNSGWALAEFRQAHAAAMLEARPRLVVILLEDPSELELDDQLRRYLATNTYVRWGDPWFWDKLALALPRPRAPDTVTTAPAAGRVPTVSPATNVAASHTARSPPAPSKASTTTPAAPTASPVGPTNSPAKPTKSPVTPTISPTALIKSFDVPTKTPGAPIITSNVANKTPAEPTKSSITPAISPTALTKSTVTPTKLSVAPITSPAAPTTPPNAPTSAIPTTVLAVDTKLPVVPTTLPASPEPLSPAAPAGQIELVINQVPPDTDVKIVMDAPAPPVTVPVEHEWPRPASGRRLEVAVPPARAVPAPHRVALAAAT